MSFWTWGLEGAMMFNPVTATGKAIYDVYTQIKNAPISNEPFYKDMFGLSATTSAINTAKDEFIKQTGAIADSIGGIGEGVADIGSGFKTAVTKTYPETFVTGAKYGTLSIALIAGVVAIYLLKRK